MKTFSAVALAVMVGGWGCGDSVIESEETSEAELPLAGTPCESVGEAVPCAGGGQINCRETSEGQVWSECLVSECSEFDSIACTIEVNFPHGPQPVSGFRQCYLDQNGVWRYGTCVNSKSSTPLVLSFDNTPVSFSHATGAFSLEPMMSVNTDWPGAETPWLVLDRNANGSIDGAQELFGSATRLLSGSYAAHGFAALAELDHNRDGLVDNRDPQFGSLKLWSDIDQDRSSTAGELSDVSEVFIESFSLSYSDAARCDDRGNCERETSTFSSRCADGSIRQGRLVDVYLRHH